MNVEGLGAVGVRLPGLRPAEPHLARVEHGQGTEHDENDAARGPDHDPGEMAGRGGVGCKGKSHTVTT